MKDKTHQASADESGHPGGIDRGESVGLMEPMLLPDDARGRSALSDLAVELASRAAGFRRSLPAGLVTGLGDLVRSMNCYYSNLIEGHDTHPVDIERALQDDYSTEPEKRDLQIEAKAHIAVQRWIDKGGVAGRATTRPALVEVHTRFCAELPESLLVMSDQAGGKTIRFVPGELRRRDVQVGRHLAISPGAVPRFLARFEQAYSGLGRAQVILSAAAAHHRFVWIHPFLDGNGRVARLMSHAMLLESLDTGGVWSVARGLARREREYKAHLQACDLTRRNDLDGRGHLSEEELGKFTRFFLETCLDQVEFMETLMQPDRLRARLLAWAGEEVRLGTLPQRAGQVLEAVLYRGELARADVAPLLGVVDRQARRVAGALQDAGVLTSDSPRARWRLGFPAALAPRLMPGLFPDRAAD